MGVDEEIEEAVRTHGWQFISISDNDPPFLYTVGFLPRHPEVIIFGLEPTKASHLMNCIAQQVKRNAPLEHKGVYDIEAQPGKIATRRVHPTQIPLHFGFAMGYCRLKGLGDVQAIQAFWPDTHGRFPFDVGCDLDVYRNQPRLDIGLSPREVANWERLWE